MNTIKKRPIKYFFIAVILLMVLIYVLPRIPDMLKTTYTLEYGELKLTDEGEACFVRNEKVYIAPKSGKPNYYIKEGDLVRRNTRVMDFSEYSEGEGSDKYLGITEQLGKRAVKSSDFLTQDVGTVSYFADGHEGEINSGTLDKITYEKFKELKGSKTLELKRDEVYNGEPAFKVVDRKGWYLVVFTDKESIRRYEKGQTVQAEFEDGQVDAIVKSVKETDGRLRVVLEVENYYENYAKKRCDDVKITTYDGKGLLISNASITKVKNREGVYVRNKTGEYDFVPVQVYLTDGETSLVANKIFYDEKGKMIETVEIYDEILKNPEQ